MKEIELFEMMDLNEEYLTREEQLVMARARLSLRVFERCMSQLSRQEVRKAA